MIRLTHTPRTLACAILLSALATASATQVLAAGPPAKAAQAASSSVATNAATPDIALTADVVRGHLGHVIDWYHRVSGLTPSPVLTDDLLTRERLKQTMLTEVRTAFRFGRAAAPLVSEVAPPVSQEAAGASGDPGQPGETDSARYVRINENLTKRAQALTAQIAQIDAQLRIAAAASRKVLIAQRAQLSASLNLTREVQQTVSDLQQFASSSNSKASGEKGLLADIADMERTVPESRLGATGAARTGAATGGSSAEDNPGAAAASNTTITATTATSAAERGETGGLLSITKEWLSLRNAIKQHTYYIDATLALSDALAKISSALTSQVRELMRQTPSAAPSSDIAQLANAKTAIDAATTRFRDLSTLLIPLGQESITLDAAEGILWQRRNGLEQRSRTLLNAALVRVAVLGASVLVILGLSALWRRATFRYLHDGRRRQQFLSLRRIITAFALTLVFVLAFLSEIGSLATYIGFLTAGLAVALQNVILAVVAYFFLIGRYGVRVGDRITLAGVTGRVAEIGLVRLYLTELGGTELHPTGRMVVLSNAVIFQPQALFKQIPGIDYTWHSTSVMIDSAADPHQARTRLQQAANAVFEHWREPIERSVSSARDRVDFESGSPAPEVMAKFSPQGLEVTVRYPVMPEDSAQVDQQMSRALYEEIEKEPKLSVAKSASEGPAANS